MIERVIQWCAHNRFLVFLATLLLLIWGVYSLKYTALDAVPDISDTQVIIYTPWEGRSPDLVEDQVTYPIVTALISAPKVKTVRGLSDFGVSYVYVIFEDNTDLYWARARVLEYLQQITGKLPSGAAPALGPDATGVGWVYQYALVSEDGSQDLASLRTLQDWFLRYALGSVPGVAEVASVGGFVKQYQVQVDPNRLAAYGLSVGGLAERIRRSNQEVEGRLLELGGREYMVRGRGYLKDLDDIKGIVVATGERGAPLLLGDVAQVSLGPEIRRGLVEMDGRGEVVGGIVVMRHGANALEVIGRVKDKLKEIAPGLPPGVRIVPTYDRSELIRLSIQNLERTLLEEMIVVSLVIVIFLLHLPSALVPILTLPLAVLAAFIPMYHLGVSSNIMSLGGIALAIGVLVDAAIVMVENAHRRLAQARPTGRAEQAAVVVSAAQQVGRALFFSLAIIIVSFVPVFLLEAQEGRMFRPLAFTKTFAMAGSSLLAITLVPVLMIIFIRGHDLKPESDNPLSRLFIRLYAPVLRLALARPWATLLLNLAVIPATALWLILAPIGSEFMPALYEGDILYMPVTNPGLSAAEAGRLLAIQDRVLKELPEVARVFGKAGRAETSTDPSPFSMMETVIQLKPRDQWRQVERDLSWLPGLLRPPARWLVGATRRLSQEELVAEMDRRLNMPGVQNAWTMPIRARIDMLSTGIRTPVGIKVAGTDLKVIEEMGGHLEYILKQIAGTRSVYAERAAGGYFLDITPRRADLARYGLSVADVQEVIQTALGGMAITRTVEGRERYSVNLRVLRELRDDPEKLARVLVPLPPAGAASGGGGGMGGGMGGGAGAGASLAGAAMVPLGQVADIALASGPAMIRDENGLLTGYVFVDVSGRDLGGYVEEARQTVAQKLKLPQGYTLAFSGQYEFKLRAEEKMKLLLPLVFFIIFVLLYLTLRSASEAAIVMISVVYAMAGGVILQKLLGYNFSVAVWVGYIALYGVAVQTGVVMVIYLHEALWQRQAGGPLSVADVDQATLDGAVLRLRPKLMTVSVVLASLLPIMWSDGVGADVMKPIAAPIIGGMVASTIHVLIITPLIFALIKRRAARRGSLRAPGQAGQP